MLGVASTSDRDNRLASHVQVSTCLPLAHNKAAVPIQTLAVPHLDGTLLCSHTCSAYMYMMVNCKLQPLIEKLVQDFNLVGAVMSHVTPMY